MAYPTEHTARQTDPSKYVDLKRENDEFGPGRDVVYGIRAAPGPRGGSTEIQSIRFDARLHSVEDAKEWLEENEFDTSKFVAAPGRPNPSRGMMIRGMIDAAERVNRREDVDTDTKRTLSAYAKEIKARQDREIDAPREPRPNRTRSILSGTLVGLPVIRKRPNPGTDKILRYVAGAGVALVVAKTVADLPSLTQFEIPEFIRKGM